MAKEEIKKLGFSDGGGGARKPGEPGAAADAPSDNEKRRERGWLAGRREPAPPANGS
jgi:hypothetical protein